MNNRPLVRKIIYIALIGVLIIPLSFIALPETRDADGQIKNAGGVLSRLRNEHELSQARLTEVDPASETMKLASLGLRGIAVNVLWSQAREQKKERRLRWTEFNTKSFDQDPAKFYSRLGIPGT